MESSNKISPFAKSVYELTKQIPLGKVTTYKIIAEALGKPNAARAVGMALSVNPYAPHVPCHRVIATDGSIGGFFGNKNKNSINVQKKITLLKQEGIKFTDEFKLYPCSEYRQLVIHKL